MEQSTRTGGKHTFTRLESRVDWNPVLRHAYYKVEVTESSGFPKFYHSRICDLDVGWLKGEGDSYTCRVRMFLESKRIYGKLGEGAFNCRITNRGDGSWEIVGADYSLNDGDPVFVINTYRKHVLFKRYAYKKKVISLKGKILQQ